MCIIYYFLFLNYSVVPVLYLSDWMKRNLACINGVFLDELDPERGRKEDEISFDCGIFCHLFFLENQEGQKDEPTKEE